MYAFLLVVFIITGVFPLELDLLVQLNDGFVQGFASDSSVNFLGIPYAKPPVGNFRWSPPQPADPWTSVLNATQFGPACPQEPWGKFWNISYINEDCLYINVFVPLNPLSSKLPVLVWIYGGGLAAGSGSQALYDGGNLANLTQSIVVTFNYRLGMFGFFGHPALETVDGITANYGFMDQVMALQWVQENILQFEGDPERVAVFGESSGGQCAIIHLISPLSAGLFNGVISESSGETEYLTTIEVLFQQTVPIANTTLGCTQDSSEGIVTCLRSLSMETILAVNENIFVPMIVVDGQIIPDNPITLFQKGEFNKVNVMIGNNENEESFFGVLYPNLYLNMTNETATEEILQVFGSTIGQHVLELYPVSSYPIPFMAYVQVFTDAAYHCPARRILKSIANSVPNVYLYHFSWTPSFATYPILGSYHTAELPYVFGHPCYVIDCYPNYHFTPYEVILTNVIQNMWSTFAATGVPTDSILGYKIPAFTSQAQLGIIFGPTITVESFVDSNNCKFWDTLNG